MSLIAILLFVVAGLTLLAGVAMFAGASKTEKVRMGWYLAASISAVVWTLSVAFFLELPVSAEAWAPWLVGGIYIGGAMLMLTLLGFSCWDTRYGKIIVVLSAAYVITITALVGANPGIFFNGHLLSESGNVEFLVDNWPYWSYIAFFIIDSIVVWLSVLRHAYRAKDQRQKKGDMVLLVGLMFTGILSCIFDVIITMSVRYDLIWVGPLAVSVTTIMFYYALLRFKVITMRAQWLKFVSHLVIVATAALAYMVIFFVVFTLMFKGSSPSTAVIILNFIMILILLLLLPIINELNASAQSMVSVQQIDLAYIVKKLNRMAPEQVDLRELAAFLADHLHYEYVGFLIKGRLYGSSSLPLSTDEVKQISLLKPTKDGSVWQQFNGPVAEIAAAQEINAVAELRDASGEVFGQIIVGRPVGKQRFERKDLIQIEMIINLVAVVIGAEKGKRK